MSAAASRHENRKLNDSSFPPESSAQSVDHDDDPGPVTGRLLGSLGMTKSGFNYTKTGAGYNTREAENMDFNHRNISSNNNSNTNDGGSSISIKTTVTKKEIEYMAGGANSSSQSSDAALVNVIPIDFVKIERNTTTDNVYPISDWQFFRTKESSKPYYILSSFGPGGLKVECPSSTEYLELICHGVSSCRIVFSKESSSEVKSENIVVYKEDRTSEAQTIRIKAPWPCKSADITFVDRYDPFISLFNVFLYTAHIRPSSMSTPIQKKDAAPRRFGY